MGNYRKVKKVRLRHVCNAEASVITYLGQEASICLRAVSSSMEPET